MNNSITETDAVNVHRNRVREGMAWILAYGERYGLDVSRFDPNTLNISSTFDCVLGQLRGMVEGLPGYHVVKDSLFPAALPKEWWRPGTAFAPRNTRLETWMIWHGFMLEDGVWGEDRDAEYRLLAEEWIAAFRAAQ